MVSDSVNIIKSSSGSVNAVVTDWLSDLNELEFTRIEKIMSQRMDTVSLLDSSDTHRSGACVYYDSGQLGASDSVKKYNVYIIPVVGGGKLFMSGSNGIGNVHIAFAEHIPDIMGMSVGDIIPGYISGANNAAPYNEDGYYSFDVPSSARYATVSTPLNVDNAITLSNVYNGAIGFKRSFFDKYLDDKIENMVTGVVTKNMFTDANSADGFVAYYNSGVILVNNDYVMCAIKVNPGQVLSFSNGFSSSHVSFINKYVPCIKDLNLIHGSKLGVCLGGFANEAKQGYTVPDGAEMMLVSVPKTKTRLLQIEEGEQSTAFTPHMIIPPGMIQNAGSSTLTVGEGKQFSTISEAVSHAVDGDEILVFPGVYDESVKAWGKNICIRGVSKRDCILTHSAEDYRNPPLEMSHGRLECITIIGTAENVTGKSPAYCMHVEDDSAKGSSFFVKDVEFINYRHACVGIGLRNDYTLEFNDCTFTAMSNNVAFYCHDHETPTTGEDSQVLILDGCTFDSKTNYVLRLQSQEIEGNHAILKARKNILVNRGNTSKMIQMLKWDNRDQGVNNYMGSYAWLLDKTSELNTLSSLNYSNQG